MYLTGVANPLVRAYAHEHGNLGLLNTPNTDYDLHDWPVWAADNGAFNAKTYVGDAKWFAWLQGEAGHAATCLFATAPDVVGDAQATLDRSRPWLPQIRALGYRAALCAQNGFTIAATPWDEFDVLFLGGSLECLPCGFVWPSDKRPRRSEPCPLCGRLLTEWKLSAAARLLVGEAKRRGLRVHMGRVNSHKRIRYADHIGADTADGTFLAFGPDQNLPRMATWLGRLHNEPTLFGGVA